MTQLLEITHDDISQLTDFQLTDLLRRLLHLEVNHNNIAARGIAVSLNITVSDGGANRVKILFTKMGSEGDLIGSANSI
jgi:hypothetical protein